jgi:hypothetical protein
VQAERLRYERTLHHHAVERETWLIEKELIQEEYQMNIGWPSLQTSKRGQLDMSSITQANDRVSVATDSLMKVLRSGHASRHYVSYEPLVITYFR